MILSTYSKGFSQSQGIAIIRCVSCSVMCKVISFMRYIMTIAVSLCLGASTYGGTWIQRFLTVDLIAE